MRSKYMGLSRQGKGDMRNGSCHRAVKLLEHEKKVVEIVLEKRLHRILTDNEMQFGFMPESKVIGTVFILRRLQDEYHDKRKKLCMCFVDLENVFDRAKNLLKWAMMEKVI